MTTTISSKFHEYVRDLLNHYLAMRGNDPTYQTLAPQEVLTLELLGLHQPLSMGKLAQLSGMLANTATGIIDRLVRRHIVERETDPQDRRFVLVKLTEYGTRLHRQHQQFAQELFSKLLVHLDHQEQKQLITLLDKLLLQTQ